MCDPDDECVVWCGRRCRRSHVPFAAERLEPAAVVLVLRASRPFGDVRETAALQLDDDLLHVLGVRHHRLGAWPAAERAKALSLALVVVEAHGRDALALDVLPDVELRPIEQRVDADVRTWRELGGVLIPEFRRLVGDVPVVLARARRKEAML